jgi:hypothetical protein
MCTVLVDCFRSCRYGSDVVLLLRWLGFGLEEYIEQEPLHRLFCSDIAEDKTRWWELWWRYGFIGPLLWHSPYTHDKVARLLPKDDMFGPLARRLFKPKARIWQRISAFRREKFAGHRVVGVVVEGGRAQLVNMLSAINGDAEADRDGLWAASAPPRSSSLPLPAAALPLLPPDTRLFVVSRDQLAMRTILRGYANSDQLIHYAHHNFSSIDDEGHLIDMWLLSLCDIVYATPWHTDVLGTLFSRKPQIALVGMLNSVVVVVVVIGFDPFIQSFVRHYYYRCCCCCCCVFARRRQQQ